MAKENRSLGDLEKELTDLKQEYWVLKTKYENDIIEYQNEEIDLSNSEDKSNSPLDIKDVKMKIQHDQEIKSLFDDYIKMYSTRDDILTNYFSDNFSGFTGGGDFLVKDKKEWIDITRQDFSQVKESLRIEHKDLSIQRLSNTIAVTTSFFTIHLPIKDHILSRETARLVLIFRKESEGWKITHSSISIPYHLVCEGEVYPLKDLEERNRFLEEMVVERTAQISSVNNKLEKKNEELVNEIASRKLVESELLESETRLQSLVSNLEAGVVVHAADTSIVMNNSRASEILGLSNDQMKGKAAIDPAWKFVYEDYTPIPLNEYPVNRILNLKQPIKNQIMGVHHPDKDGFVWAMINGFPVLNINGEISEIVISFIDITERKKAEEALRKSETIKNTMLSNISDVIVIIDKDGINQYKSLNITKLFGWQPEELVGKYTWDNVHADDLDAVQKFMTSIFNEPNASGTTELRFKCKDGNYVWIEISVINLLHDKNIQGILGNYHEITEHKRIEKELITAKEKAEESQEKYLAMYNNAPLSYQSLDENGCFIDINPMWLRTLGYERSEVIGKWYGDFLHPDYVEHFRINFPAFKKRGYVSDVQFKLRRKDNTFIYVSFEGCIGYTAEGKFRQTYCVFKDITEQKALEIALIKAKEKAEENEYRLKLAAESGRFGIWDWNVKDNVMIWDNRMFELYGISNDTFTETIDAWLNGLHPEDKQRALDECTAALNGGKDFNTTFRVLQPNGQVKYLKADALVIRDENGKAERMIGLNVDVTGVKLVELELEKHRYHLEELVELRTAALDKANDLLKREIEKEKEYELLLQQSLVNEKDLSEMKSRFISTTSHEFRTPLTSILSSSGLLKRYSNKWDDDKKNEHFERIENSVSYLVKLLDDILTISHADSRRINYDPKLIDIKQLVKECIADAPNLSIPSRIKSSYKLLQKEYLLDRTLMKFILNNLLSNAIKYSPDANEVKIAISHLDKYLVVKVVDKGIGIPQEEMEKIFDSFYRSKNAVEIKGTGLGLAIVKRAVEIHGGEISVSSELNIGTTFTVKIPVK